MENSTDRSQTITVGLNFTAEEEAELKKAREMPITFDEDCPETTPERALKFKRVNPPRRSSNPA